MKIAFLFLTIDDLLFPQIWEYYFKSNYDKINIYCHPKYPERINTKWLKKSVVKKLTKTKWGHFTNAIINLFKAALLDKDNQKFIIVSESCLPIKSFTKLYYFLKNDNIKTSYIHLRKFDDVNIIKSKLPNNYLNYELIKHSGWFCLSRHHVKKLLINNDIYKFNKVIAGDEHIFSLIYPNKNIKNYKITFVNWNYAKNVIENINKDLHKLYERKESENTKKYDKQILNLRIQKCNLAKHPKTYSELNENDVKQIMQSKSFFMRKFSKDSNIVDKFKSILNEL
tara:strand:+ start:533 stop:1381 length:849 start_codon:yes stop_codon:yes gene_type:complete